MVRSRIGLPVVFIIATLLLGGSSACNRTDKDRQLAEQHCGSCHLFPEPALLDKKTWIEGIKPQMAIRMGLSLPDFNAMDPEEYQKVLAEGGLPAQAMITGSDWNRIWRYYEREAPAKALFQQKPLSLSSEDEEVFQPKILWQSPAQSPTFSMLNFDQRSLTLLAGMREGKVFKYIDGVIQDSLFAPSSPSQITFNSKGHLLMLLMGKMDPNDLHRGLLLEAKRTPQRWEVVKPWITQLNRPVHFCEADLDEDGNQDWVVCEFGHFLGKLAWYKISKDGTTEEKVLLRRPGARLTQAVDLDRDGKTDLVALMAQGDEQIIWFKNQGKGNFEQKTLLRFPPIYGSSYLDVQDINLDGLPDLIHSAGDNYDYSYSLKKYHGIRIYLNQGKGEFKLQTFIPMPGASKVLAADFNQDQLTDIVAISYFPDYHSKSLAGLVFFKNLGQGRFGAYSLPMGDSANWLLMEKGDLDADGDLDLVLGAGSINNTVPKYQKIAWEKQGIGLLVLENQTK